MTSDMKRLCEAAEDAVEQAIIDGSFDREPSVEAIVRAVLMELREVSEESADVAWSSFNWLGPDRAGGDEQPTPERVVAVMLDAILAEPVEA